MRLSVHGCPWVFWTSGVWIVAENTPEMAEKVAGHHWPLQSRPHVDRRRHLLGSLLVRHLRPTAMAQPQHNPQGLLPTIASYMQPQNGYVMVITTELLGTTYHPKMGKWGCMCVCVCIRYNYIYIHTHMRTIIDHKANIKWGSQFRQRVLTR